MQIKYEMMWFKFLHLGLFFLQDNSIKLPIWYASKMFIYIPFLKQDTLNASLIQRVCLL